VDGEEEEPVGSSEFKVFLNRSNGELNLWERRSGTRSLSDREWTRSVNPEVLK
jgi:hypothetical protein